MNRSGLAALLLILALNSLSGYAFSRTSAYSPMWIAARSFSYTSHTTQTSDRSEIVNRFGELSSVFTPPAPTTSRFKMRP